LGFALVGVGHHVHERHRHDLPRHAELVLEPAALLRFDRPARAEIAPEMVDFFLVLAVDLKRNRLIELEQRPAIEAGKGVASSSKLTVITEPSGRPWNSWPALP